MKECVSSNVDRMVFLFDLRVVCHNRTHQYVPTKWKWNINTLKKWNYCFQDSLSGLKLKTIPEEQCPRNSARGAHIGFPSYPIIQESFQMQLEPSLFPRLFEETLNNFQGNHSFPLSIIQCHGQIFHSSGPQFWNMTTSHPLMRCNTSKSFWTIQDFWNVQRWNRPFSYSTKEPGSSVILYIFIHEVRSSGLCASITTVYIRKFYKM